MGGWEFQPRKTVRTKNGSSLNSGAGLLLWKRREKGSPEEKEPLCAGVTEAPTLSPGPISANLQAAEWIFVIIRPSICPPNHTATLNPPLPHLQVKIQWITRIRGSRTFDLTFYHIHIFLTNFFSTLFCFSPTDFISKFQIHDNDGILLSQGFSRTLKNIYQYPRSLYLQEILTQLTWEFF